MEEGGWRAPDRTTARRSQSGGDNSTFWQNEPNLGALAFALISDLVHDDDRAPMTSAPPGFVDLAMRAVLRGSGYARVSSSPVKRATFASSTPHEAFALAFRALCALIEGYLMRTCDVAVIGLGLMGSAALDALLNAGVAPRR
jgi:hypothetical protein